MEKSKDKHKHKHKHKDKDKVADAGGKKPDINEVKEKSSHNKEKSSQNKEKSSQNKEKSSQNKEKSSHKKEKSIHKKEKSIHKTKKSIHKKEKSIHKKEGHIKGVHRKSRHEKKKHSVKTKVDKKDELVLESEPRIFNIRLQRALRPIKQILIWCGRYPFSSEINSDTSYNFKSSFKKPGGVYFLFVTFLNFYIFIMGTYNILALNIKQIDNSSAKSITRRRSADDTPLIEKAILTRHSIALIVIWVALLHNLIVSGVIFCRRRYIAAFLGLWTRAIITMHLDLGRKLFSYCFSITVIFFTLIGALTTLTILGIGPSTKGGSALLAVLLLRLFYPEMARTVEETGTPAIMFDVAEYTTGILVLFNFVASKGWVLFFLAHCKLLRNAFGIWNGRVYAAVLRGGDFVDSPEGRTTYKVLYKDHCLLLDLMEGTNKVFSHIIESYFGLQIFSLCFESYFFIRTFRSGEFDEENKVSAVQEFFFIRPSDWIPGLVVLTTNVWILIIISRTAAAVGEEAIAGLEVLRRKTMLGRKTDEELYFMLSTYASFTAYERIEVCSGGYFYLDKEFVVGIGSTILSYAIIIYQFQPTLDFTFEEYEERQIIGRYLEKLEDLEKCHWAWPRDPRCMT